MLISFRIRFVQASFVVYLFSEFWIILSRNGIQHLRGTTLVSGLSFVESLWYFGGKYFTASTLIINSARKFLGTSCSSSNINVILFAIFRTQILMGNLCSTKSVIYLSSNCGYRQKKLSANKRCYYQQNFIQKFVMNTEKLYPLPMSTRSQAKRQFEAFFVVWRKDSGLKQL